MATTMPPLAETADPKVAGLVEQAAHLGAPDAAVLLAEEPAEVVVAVLGKLGPAAAADVIAEMSVGRRGEVFGRAPQILRRQWELNQAYPEGTIGRIMDEPVGQFPPDLTVADAVARLREMVKRAFITYGYVVDGDGRLLGVLVMREMLLAEPSTRLRDLMLRSPFTLPPTLDVMEAMRRTVGKHFPVYPVADEAGKLVGLIRGQTLFEQQAVELTAQAGAMVGVDKEERLATPWTRSLKFRHPWLQLNLLTCFVAAAVVGFFQGTIDKIVVLAAFLPVLAGQSGNTGCQALAVALRAMTLGELKPGGAAKMVAKEALLGLLNGMLVGVSAGVGMYVTCRMQETEGALTLAVITWMAMTGACVLSGVSGAVVPLILRRIGADPATASSIFLTTATDVASMGMFLGLATVLMM